MSTIKIYNKKMDKHCFKSVIIPRTSVIMASTDIEKLRLDNAGAFGQDVDLREGQSMLEQTARVSGAYFSDYEDYAREQAQAAKAVDKSDDSSSMDTDG